MHDETIKSIAFVANNKVKRFNDSIMKYSISSVFAGSYIGIGILLTFTIGGILSQAGNPFSKIVMGFSCYDYQSGYSHIPNRYFHDCD